MRRFVITSPKYTGQAEVVYNAIGVLDKIDVSATNMNAPTVDAFKRCVSPLVETLSERFTADTIIIEADFEVSFEMFWKKYNKKINKFRCIKIWDKMEKTMQVKAYFGIDAYHKYLKHESWRSKADPETYLRNQYWDNEYK